MIVEEINKNGWSVSSLGEWGFLELQGFDDDMGLTCYWGQAANPQGED